MIFSETEKREGEKDYLEVSMFLILIDFPVDSGSYNLVSKT